MGPEKRLPLALFLCFIVLMVVQFRNAPEPPPGNGSETQTASNDALLGGGGAASVDADAVPESDDSEVSVEPQAPPTEADSWDEWMEVGADGEIGHMWIHFHSLGGSVAEIRYADHFVRLGLSDEEKRDRDNMVPIVEPAVENERTLHSLMVRSGLAASELFSGDPAKVHWKHDVLPGAGVVFTYEDPSGVVLEKRIEHVPGENHLRVELGARTTNAEHQNKRVTMELVASVGMPQVGEDSFYPEPKAVAALVDKDIKDKSPDTSGDPRRGNLVTGDIAFFGTHNKYFAMLARPTSESARKATREATFERIFDMRWALLQPKDTDLAKEGFRDVLVSGLVDVTFPPVGAPANTYDYVVYSGPKDPGQFTEADKPFNDIIREDLGFFDGIAALILGFLRFLHGIFGNWGWAIIFLTLTVRLILFPLNRRMQTSMARHATKMKRVQPKIDAIKKKYADKPQELRQEQAKIFQQEGVMPPLGGCLPMFLQIPIFFGLFSALRVSFDLRHEPFMGWIKDLSQPDRLARIDLNTHLPFIGTIEWFNLLPILMVILWVAQQRVMPRPKVQDEQAKQMQKIMTWMPIMFGFFLYNYAAGLSLYMITTSAFGILESTVIRKIWPIDDTEQPKKKGKFMQRLEELQKQAEIQQRQKQKGAGPKKGPRKGPGNGPKKGPKRGPGKEGGGSRA